MPGKLITIKKKNSLLKATPVKKRSVGKKPEPASLIAQRNTRRQEAFLPVDATYVNSAPVIVPDKQRIMAVFPGENYKGATHI